MKTCYKSRQARKHIAARGIDDLMRSSLHKQAGKSGTDYVGGSVFSLTGGKTVKITIRKNVTVERENGTTKKVVRPHAHIENINDVNTFDEVREFFNSRYPASKIDDDYYSDVTVICSNGMEFGLFSRQVKQDYAELKASIAKKAELRRIGCL